MALLSKSELSEKFSLPTNQLAVMIKRALTGKKIMMDGERIDDSNPLNKAWIDKYASKAQAKGKVKPDTSAAASPEAEPEINEYAVLETEKLKQQVEKLRNENRKLKLSNEKTVGVFVQVDHVTLLMVQLSEAGHLAWENEFESVMVDLGGRFGLSREEITTIKAEKVKLSNLARERTLKEAKKMLRRLQNEASDKRGVGEHG